MSDSSDSDDSKSIEETHEPPFDNCIARIDNDVDDGDDDDETTPAWMRYLPNVPWNTNDTNTTNIINILLGFY